MQKKKGLALVLSFALVACLAVAGTLAWLTSQSETVTNTFTVGDVDITLDEARADQYGDVADANDRVEANQYKLIPGHDYDKDPTVHVTSGSEPCYVFVKVDNGLAAFEDQDELTIAQQLENLGWTAIEDGSNIYYYTNAATGSSIVDARNAQQNLVVFQNFVLSDAADFSVYADEDQTNGVLSGLNIVIEAYAVQADGFADAADAWAKSPNEAWNQA